MVMERQLCSSKFAVEGGPEHSGRYPSGQPVAGPDAARGVGVAELTAAAGHVPVAHVEVLVEGLTRGVTPLADDADEPHDTWEKSRTIHYYQDSARAKPRGNK